MCIDVCSNGNKHSKQAQLVNKTTYSFGGDFSHTKRETHTERAKKKTNQMAKNDGRVRATSTRSIAIRRCWDAMRARVNIIRSEIHLDIVRAAL